MAQHKPSPYIKSARHLSLETHLTMLFVSPTSSPAPPSSPMTTTFLINQRRQLGKCLFVCFSDALLISLQVDVINQLLKQLGECTQTATQLVDLMYYTPSSSCIPSSPTSSASSFSKLTATSKPPLSPVFCKPDSSIYTSSPAQPQRFVPRRPTSSLVSGPHPINPNSPTNPNGLIGSFIPGELTLNGHAQRIYNGFVYNVPLPCETGQLYLITVGHRVGIIAGW